MKIKLTEDQWWSKGKNILEEIVEQGRWETVFRYVFQWEDGKYYQAFLSEGSTESQPGYWENNDTVECEEVHEVEKVVKVWEPKP